MEFLIHVHAHFQINNRSTANYYIRLFEKDLLKDDFLQQEKLNDDGNVSFVVNPADYRGGDSPLEKKPDFYMTVVHENEVIFQTPVANDIDIDRQAEFNMEEGTTIDLGTFVI